jgi:hypothetical protein
LECNARDGRFAAFIFSGLAARIGFANFMPGTVSLHAVSTQPQWFPSG